MNSKTSDAIGIALLSIGGGLVAGKIISELLEDEGPPGRPSTSTRKKKIDQTLGSKGSNKYIVEIQPPSQVKGSRSVTNSPTVEKKYPDNYYSLSKSQQYKYRKRLAEELYDISQK